jgi:hypothetical protein
MNHQNQLQQMENGAMFATLLPCCFAAAEREDLDQNCVWNQWRKTTKGNLTGALRIPSWNAGEVHVPLISIITWFHHPSSAFL